MTHKFHKNFLKEYTKLPHKLQQAVNNKLSLFENNPTAMSLKTHSLSGKYKGYRSISITGDLRAIYKELYENKVIFVKIGTHSKLYK